MLPQACPEWLPLSIVGRDEEHGRCVGETAGW
jgi:hypothetical protein